MNKTIILPLIALLALVLKNWFGIEIGTEIQDNIAESIVTLIALYGVFKDHTKKPPTMQGLFLFQASFV